MFLRLVITRSLVKLEMMRLARPMIKVGRVMGLTYPAGREIDELAHQGQDVYDFPRAMIKEDNLEFHSQV